MINPKNDERSLFPGMDAMREAGPARATRDPDAMVPRVVTPHRKWFNSSVVRYEGSLSEIRERIPTFERRPFELGQPKGQASRPNPYLETIVRMPIGKDESFVPVGVVSKTYTLVPHGDVLDVAIKALDEARIELDEVGASMQLTQFGERMALSLFLPQEYRFDPGDGHPMALRLECLNSVDGSTRFRVLMGWFRFVCSNGLIIGITRSVVRRRHTGEVGLGDVGAVLASGLVESAAERKNFEQWRKTDTKPNKLTRWIDADLRKVLGFKAAARTFHIASTGFDGLIVGPYKDESPTSIPMKNGAKVPGAPVQCRNLFDLSQILAWLAKERRDLQEQLEWKELIPSLMASFGN